MAIFLFNMLFRFFVSFNNPNFSNPKFLDLKSSKIIRLYVYRFLNLYKFHSAIAITVIRAIPSVIIIDGSN